jgi:hypothetical protein
VLDETEHPPQPVPDESVLIGPPLHVVTVELETGHPPQPLPDEFVEIGPPKQPLTVLEFTTE